MSKDLQPSLITPFAMCSYPNIAKPRAGENDDGSKKDPRFSIALVFDPVSLKKQKDGVKKYKALHAAVLACARDKWGEKAKTMLEEGSLRSPFRYLEDEPSDSPKHEDYPEGAIWIQPGSKSRPNVVDRYDSGDGTPVKIELDEIEEKLYPGCRVRASVRAYWYDKKGNRGVAFALNNIQKVGEGERLDGRKSATEEFDALEDAADLPTGDEEQDEEPVRHRKTAKKARRVEVDDDDEQDEDDEEEEELPRRKKSAKKSRRIEVDEDDDESEDGEADDEDEAPRRRKATGKKTRRDFI